MGCDLVAGGHPPNPLTLREGGKIGSYARNDRAGWHPSLPLWIPAFAGMTFTRCDDGFSLGWRFLVGMTVDLKPLQFPLGHQGGGCGS